MINCYYKFNVLVFAVILSITFSFFLVAEEKSTEEEPVIHDIKLTQIETLLSEKKRGLIIINLWATWCPPCVSELPYFGDIYKKYSEEQVHIYLINIEGKEIKEKVLKPFLKKNSLPCPVYLLEEGKPEELEKVLSTEISGALPITLIYNSDGKLIKKFEGAITVDDIKSVLRGNGILPISPK
ncbi:MAG: redoxin domain-containing protein [Candidatus Hydrogenedens sp.]